MHTETTHLLHDARRAQRFVTKAALFRQPFDGGLPCGSVSRNRSWLGYHLRAAGWSCSVSSAPFDYTVICCCGQDLCYDMKEKRTHRKLGGLEVATYAAHFPGSKTAAPILLHQRIDNTCCYTPILILDDALIREGCPTMSAENHLAPHIVGNHSNPPLCTGTTASQEPEAASPSTARPPAPAKGTPPLKQRLAPRTTAPPPAASSWRRTAQFCALATWSPRSQQPLPHNPSSRRR